MSGKISHAGIELELNYPVFKGQTQPNGFLVDEVACHACWYYYTLATHALEKVGESIDDQIIYEGEMWMDTHFHQQKRSVATLYGLKDPADMDKFWGHVAAEAKRIGLPSPDGRIMLRQRIII